MIDVYIWKPSAGTVRAVVVENGKEKRSYSWIGVLSDETLLEFARDLGATVHEEPPKQSAA